MTTGGKVCRSGTKLDLLDTNNLKGDRKNE
jgi:hypothetical protein